MDIFAEYPTLSGLNVTTPYKELVIPYMDDMDESAKAVGAVNVIKIIRGAKDNDIKLVGFNSDMMGFRQSIEPLIGAGMERAFVLGTGGASKAVAAALKSLNIDVDFVSRRKSAATTTVSTGNGSTGGGMPMREENAMGVMVKVKPSLSDRDFRISMSRPS